MPNIIIPRFDNKCVLCRKNIADKTGSHLTPNFLIHSAFSFDGKGLRDREIVEHHFLNEMKRLSTYYGPQVSPDRVELGLGHQMTDEEFDGNQSPLKFDYLFCTECEEKFSVIESEYAAFYKGIKKSIYPRIAYLFWLSVIWRMGIGRMGFYLELNDEFAMRDILQNNLSLSAESIIKSTVDLGNFRYALWHSNEVGLNDTGVIGSRYEFQPYMGLLGETAILMYSKTPEGNEVSYGNITFLVSILNDWMSEVKINEEDRRWMLNLKDFLIDSSYDYFDPHREQALLQLRERERTTNEYVPDEIKEIAIKAKRLSGNPTVYFQKQHRLRKAKRIFMGYFKQKEYQSKGICYNPLQDEELALIPEDYTKYYYDLADLESNGIDITEFPYIEEARRVVPEAYFHQQRENDLLEKYHEALEWFAQSAAEASDN